MASPFFAPCPAGTALQAHCSRGRAIGCTSARNSMPVTQRSSRYGSAPRRMHRTQAAPELPDLDSLLGALDIPDIGGDLLDMQTDQGAVFDDAGVVAHFKNNSRAMYALEHAAVVVDRSHWGRLRLSGDDRLAFLHGQTTNDMKALKPGTGCDTVFVTAQARTIDLATVYAQQSGALVVVSPGMKEQLAQRLDKYIFPADKVQLTDISSKTCMFSVLGPNADAVMQQMQAGGICEAPYASHTLLSFSGKPVIAAVGGGLPGPGFTFVCDESVAADVWKALAAQELLEPMGSEAFEMARVLAGRPAPGAELTEDFNPLEAGLYHAVSVDKGCYMGQETISKVHNRNAVRQQLWVLEMEAPCAVGSEVVAAADGRKLGAVTSYIDTPSTQHRALAYLKCKVEGKQVDLEGLAVSVGGVRGRVVAPPFVSRNFGGEPAALGDEQSAATAAAGAEEAAAVEATRRADKLREMQERLAAYQAQLQQQQEQ